MVALTKIDVELHLAGLKFEQEQWLDFMGAILLDPAEGLNSIRTAQQLVQAKTNPLLEDHTAWQLVLRWAADDNLSFPDFLTEMQSNFKDRYKFNEWKTIFDQVFEASHNGTAMEVVRAAMTEHGVLDCPSVHDLSLQASSSADISPTRPSGQASSSQPRKASCKSRGPLPPAKCMRMSRSILQFLDTSMQDGDDDESEHEGNRDSAVHRSPRVTEITPSGRTTFNKRLEHIVNCYNHEGSAEGSSACMYRSPVHKAEVGMDVDVGPIELRVYMIELPTSQSTAHFLAQHLTSSLDDLGSLEISVHDFKLEFPIGASIKVIAGLDCGFQGMVISRQDDMFLLQGSDQQVEVPGIFLASYISPTTYASRADDQVWHDPLANENHLQPGDLVRVISGPHKDLCGTLHYYSGRELLVTLSVIQPKSTADLGDKGKSKAEEPNVTRGNSDVHEDSDLIQISVCMDDAIVIPPNTLQFSKERGYDVTVGDHV
ncbi:hypothetical protein BKA83DRAFT_14313 [Pisolithus microcarpus]|nr:hypothetical protein BKA83DRAFT_14313 [Pisolithus microcarpus]